MPLRENDHAFVSSFSSDFTLFISYTTPHRVIKILVAKPLSQTPRFVRLQE
jgi:hypothetical protein